MRINRESLQSSNEPQDSEGLPRNGVSRFCSRKLLRYEFRHSISTILAHGDAYSGHRLGDEFSLNASGTKLWSFLDREFRTCGNRQEKRNPNWMHHLKATLAKIVGDRDNEEGQAEVTSLCLRKYCGKNTAVPGDQENS